MLSMARFFSYLCYYKTQKIFSYGSFNTGDTKIQVKDLKCIITLPVVAIYCKFWRYLLILLGLKRDLLLKMQSKFLALIVNGNKKVVFYFCHKPGQNKQDKT